LSSLARLAAISLLAVVLVACAASPSSPPAANPTSAAAPATAAPTPTTAAAPSQTATAIVASKSTASPSPAVTPAVTASAVATTATLPAVAAGQTIYRVVSHSSEARFRVKEQLAGRDLPNDAVGATKDVSGQIVLDSNGKVVKDASRIVVGLAGLKSDQDRRDNFLRQNTLDTARYPEAVFVPTEIRGLPSPLPTSGEVKFDLIGDLTIKGVTKPTTWKVEAKANGSTLTGKAETQLAFADFGIEKPRVAAVLSVDDSIRLEADLAFQRPTN